MPTTFANTINGSYIYAKRAEQDKDGNQIDTTYAKKTEIPSVPVIDVTVDGNSVVSNGTAAITMPTVDQTYDASSANAQSGTAVAGAIAGVEQVPAVTSSDDGKVLKASYSGGQGSYSWQTESGGGGGTVDQTYNASSTNAQSGTAVAQAISEAIGPIESALANL